MWPITIEVLGSLRRHVSSRVRRAYSAPTLVRSLFGPALYCGIVGLKLSYGLLSRYAQVSPLDLGAESVTRCRWGVVSFADSLDCFGILSKQDGPKTDSVDSISFKSNRRVPHVPTRNDVLPISNPIVGVSGKVYRWTDSCGVGDVRVVKTTDSGRSISNSVSLGKRVKWDKGRWREIGSGTLTGDLGNSICFTGVADMVLKDPRELGSVSQMTVHRSYQSCSSGGSSIENSRDVWMR
jgi:hypothetical protein